MEGSTLTRPYVLTLEHLSGPILPDEPPITLATELCESFDAFPIYQWKYPHMIVIPQRGNDVLSTPFCKRYISISISIFFLSME